MKRKDPPTPDHMTNRVSRRGVMIGGAAIAAGAAMPSSAAFGQASYLSGRSLSVITGFSDGAAGGAIYFEWANAAGRLLPDTVVNYRRNAAGTKALAVELLADAAPDGLTIGDVSPDSLVARHLGEYRHDLSDFIPIAALGRSTDILFASAESGITSVADLQARGGPLPVPVRATVSGAYFQSYFCNALLGTRLRPVTGYSSSERELAFLSGETELLIRGERSGIQYVRDGAGMPLLKFGSGEVLPEYGNVPSIADLDVNPDFGWIVDYFEAASLLYVMCAHADTPSDRVAVLRDVFMRATDDPQFRRAVASLTVLAPVDGESVQSEVTRTLSQFSDLGEAIEVAVACGAQLAETGEACVL